LISEVSRIITKLEEKTKNDTHLHSVKLGKLKIKGVTTIEIFEIEDIMYAEAEGRYTSFFLRNGRIIICTKNLGYFNDILPKSLFSRIHSKYLVSINDIETITKGNSPSCILSSGSKLSISRRRLENLLDDLEKLQ